MPDDEIKNQSEVDFKASIIKAYIYMLQAKKESTKINISTTDKSGITSNQSYTVYMKDFDELAQKIKDRIK